MIVHNLYLVGVSVFPDEANPPLIVDADAVLPLPVSRKGLKSIPGRYSQVIQIHSVMEHHQLALRPTLDLLREPADTPAFGYRLCIPVAVAFDHELMVAHRAISVNRH